MVGEGIGRIERSVMENNRGEAVQSDEEGVPRSEATLSKDAKDTKPEETNTGVGENVYCPTI